MSDDRPKRIEFTVSDELWDRINEARGFEPRASFVKRVLESALSAQTKAPELSEPTGASPSAASTRTPEEPVATVMGSPVRKIKKSPTTPHELQGLRNIAETVMQAEGERLQARAAFKCPIARCEFRARSAAAKCGAHGRTVVPV